MTSQSEITSKVVTSGFDVSKARYTRVHQKYKYIGYYVDPTTDPYSNFTTITGLLPGYDRFPQSAPTRSKDHYCVSLLNELYFAWVCDENLNAVCSNFTYVPITTEPIPNTTRHNPTSTEPIPETSERVHTTTEPILTTTEPIQTTSESSQTTTEPIQTTTEPIQTTAEFIQSTTEYMQTTREPSPTTTITSHKTTSETSNGCDCVEFCRPSNYNSTNALLINDTEKLQERLKAISDILKVEKSTLSSVVRKKTSAPDERTSSTNIGYFGIAIIVSAISILVMFDIIKCFQTCFG
ncbi:hypothetical protein FSP39_011291 [Pinctada imbricata]|uniref:Uncharacterized protein n=1 Tax=Pinctada imbricata TaxID=66713 RepID=A0AA89BSX8_PINIB|nr:hypothetical protein FSP39_011291 [Pinctada imbricata]